MTEAVAVPVRFEVPRTDVRFFHGTDRAAADGVASVLARGVAGAAQGPRLHSFLAAARERQARGMAGGREELTVRTGC